MQAINARVELHHFGRAHANGDVVALFPADRVLAAGDMFTFGFTFGDATPGLIDYAGGGSAKEWTSGSRSTSTAVSTARWPSCSRQ